MTLSTKRPPAKFRGFVLQFPADQLEYWAGKYTKTDDDNALEAGRRISTGDPSRRNLETIVVWKSPRRAGLLSENTDGEIEEALGVAAQAKQPRTALAVLMGLQGVGLPMASAILTCIDPQRYTVIDWRALEGLGSDDLSDSLEFYLNFYLPECIRLSALSGLDLRSIDRALWSWSESRGSKT